MPQIKKDFSAGKMNKDLDERIVPNGQYRDAMNIQVRTTNSAEGGEGNAGTVQNMPGTMNIAPNGEIKYESLWSFPMNINEADTVNESAFVGGVANEKNNKAYFFLAAPPIDKFLSTVSDEYNQQEFINSASKRRDLYDYIIEVDINDAGSTCVPVVVDRFAVMNDVDGLLDVATLPTGEFTKLNVLDQNVANSLRVGMIMKAYKLPDLNNSLTQVVKSTYKNVEPEWDQSTVVDGFEDEGAEIQQIKGTEILFYTQQDAVNWNEVGFVTFTMPDDNRVLNFHPQRTITGINIIDDLLFWTDDNDEPKRINIKKCIAGTNNWSSNTKLKLQDPQNSDLLKFAYSQWPYTEPYAEASLSSSINNDLKKEHVTVIRKAPTSAPVIEMSESDRGGETTVANVFYNFADYDDTDNDIVVGASFQIPSEADIAGGDDAVNDPAIFNNISYELNDIVRFDTETTDPDSWLTASISSIDFSGDYKVISFTVLTKNKDLIYSSLITNSGYWTATLQAADPLFELKFGRFGTRYKYENGEYSNFGPWSEVAFLPGHFNYDHKRGYNTGMANVVRTLKIKGFIPHQRVRPADVVAVDILYKTTESPNVYVVKTIRRGVDPEWDNFVPNYEWTDLAFGELNITSEMIHKVLPNNQALRAWDNVPKKALAQEVAANRLVYANVEQGYDVNNQPKVESSLKHYRTPEPINPQKSMKTLRDYKVGMVFGDKYGRETPVFSATYIDQKFPTDRFSVFDGTVHLSKKFSAFQNKLQLQQHWGETNEGIPDDWISYIKYYIKETSNEYYNLVMDRWYPAEDGNIWLSFPSADRNKVDEDTYIILKNEHGTENAVAEAARYKIIAIDNEAPDFIKQQERDMGQILLGSFEEGGEAGWTDDMYTEFMWSGAPNPLNASPSRLMTGTEIAITNTKWNGFLDGYQAQGDLQIRLKAVSVDNVVGSICPWRLVTYQHKVEDDTDTTIDGTGILRWDKPFNASTMFSQLVEDNGSAPLPSISWQMEFKETITKSQPEFEGKFFVKIEKDEILSNKVLGVAEATQYYEDDVSYSVCYIDNQEYNPGAVFNEFPGPRRGYKWFNQLNLALYGTPYAVPISQTITYGVTSDFTYTVDGLDYTENINLAADDVSVAGNIGNVNVVNLASSDYSVFSGDQRWRGEQGGTGDANWEACGNSYITGCHPYDAEFMALGCVHGEADGEGDQSGQPFGGEDSPENVMNRSEITWYFWRWFHNHASTMAGDGSPADEGAHGARIFIDGMRARRTRFEIPGSANGTDKDIDGYTGTYYKNTAFEEGRLVSNEVDTYNFSETQGELGAVTFSILGNWVQDETLPEFGFRDKFLTQGTRFRFNRDPKNEVYIVVSKSGVSAWEMESKNFSEIHWNIMESIPNPWPSNPWGPDNEAPGSKWWNSPWYGESSAQNNIDYASPICTNALDCYAPLKWTNINPKHSPNGIQYTNVVRDGDGVEISASTLPSGYADGETTFVNVGGIQSPNSGYYNSGGDGWSYDNIPSENAHITCVPCGEHTLAAGFEWYTDSNDPITFTPQDIQTDNFCVRKSIKIEFRRISKETGEIIPNGGIDTSVWDPRSAICHDGREAMSITTLKQITIGGDIYIPPANAAIWETEPKEDVGLDIYYEASNALPIRLTSENTSTFAPYNSPITMRKYTGSTYRDYLIDVVSATYTGLDPVDNTWAYGDTNDDGSPITQASRNHRLYYIGYTKSHSVIGIKGEKYNPGQVAFSTSSGGGAPGPNFWAGEEGMIGTESIMGNYLVFHHSNGTKTMSKVISHMEPIDDDGVTITPSTINTGVTNYITITNTKETRFRECESPTGFYKIDSNVWKFPVELGWHNCWSFGNGVESDRIRDDFNANQMDNGVKASSTIMDYGKEVLGSRMIYSGLYNSTSGVNNLNEFNMAEKITKDINPSYGSIQALKTRDTDMVVLAEDKILKVTTNKDALYNADGNPQLIASNRVLGTAVPYAGDYGISKNPESLAWDQYRVYFTDMQRGAVLRLSRDGLTPISNVGMKTWFRDNLKKHHKLLGTFDIVNGEYNLSLKSSFSPSQTISFNEDSKGWVSFKSFIPQTGVSVAGQYITAVSRNFGVVKNTGDSIAKQGIFIHHKDRIVAGSGNKIENRNCFYMPWNQDNFEDYYTESKITAMFNEMPDIVKGFRAVTYEGSQSKIIQNLQDDEYYNLNNVDGWWVDNIKTDLSDSGEVVNFKNKEGKWFQKIGGKTKHDISKNSLKEFSVQGLGLALPSEDENPTSVTITIVNEDDNE